MSADEANKGETFQYSFDFTDSASDQEFDIKIEQLGILVIDIIIINLINLARWQVTRDL